VLSEFLTALTATFIPSCSPAGVKVVSRRKIVLFVYVAWICAPRGLAISRVVPLIFWIVPVAWVKQLVAVVVAVDVVTAAALELPQAATNVENSKSIVPARSWPGICLTRITLVLLFMLHA